MSGIIEKPEGYDLREKRADKNRSAADWTAKDAIYSTHERIRDQDVTQLIVTGGSARRMAVK